nr:diguanylate cyclase [Paracraurococcus ruber]
MAFCCLLAFTLIEARQERWERAGQGAQNLAQAMADDIGRTIGSLDLSLQAVVDYSRLSDVMELPPAARDRVLFDRAASAPELGRIFLLDRHGDVVASGGAGPPVFGNFADREYFTLHRDKASDAVLVGSAFRSRVSAQAVFAVSRRVPAADGSFDGVAIGTVRLAPIRTKFEAVRLGPRDSMTLVHEDGTLMMRAPYQAAVVGSEVSHSKVFRQSVAASTGTFIGRSTIDHVERFHAFAQVPGAPMRLIISHAVDDLEAGWWRQTTRAGLGTVALVALACGMAWLLYRELQQRQRAEAALTESEAGFRLLAEHSTDMVSRIGPDDIRRYVSPAAVRLLGRAPQDLVGRRPQEAIHSDDLDGVASAIMSLHRGKTEEAMLTYRVRHAEGRWVWVESSVRTVYDPRTGEPDGIVAISRDISERKVAEQHLVELAWIDGLTSIPNRRSFDAALEQEWRRCRRAGGSVSLLLIDVDRFKALNDSRGHQHGDWCLQQIAASLRSVVRRAGDVVARYGGEEFVMLLPNTDAQGATEVAERLRAAVERLALAHPDGGTGGAVTVSVGAATVLFGIAGAAECATDLTGTADRCLYAAKQAGRNRVVHAMCRLADQTRGQPVKMQQEA